MQKKSALAAGLEAAAKRPAPPAPLTAERMRHATRPAPPAETVLVGGHFPPEVRKALKLIGAEKDMELKALLGEAINDLCAKYGKPQPYTGEE